ncbi:hypothetical protein [Thalassolituus oleivorans]|uniref:hypothetical protein n=1 Tax=Thalassolituus oleivorans TaxID=187493 RepID=UPI00042DD9DC|nr:hypothetical protein [Thalassolituus oleivorans]AHK17813.1 hypothetical protein R615_14240 [Thalassolituus oleivorans R6-15]
MVKKTLLSLAVAAATAGLAGCNISSVEGDNNKVDLSPVTAGSAGSTPSSVAPIFSAGSRKLPLNIDLLFADASTSDGTANTADTTPPVTTAINKLDGFSNTAAFYVNFNAALAPESVIAGQTVFLIKLKNAVDNAAIDALDITSIIANGGASPVAADQPEGGTDYDARYITLDGGATHAIQILPKTPLDPKTKYIVAMTNSITSASGEAVTGSAEYELLSGALQLPSSALAPVRAAVQGWEQIAGGFLAAATSNTVTQDDIVLSYAFTTGGTVDVLNAMAAPATFLTTQITTIDAAEAAITASVVAEVLDAGGDQATADATAVATLDTIAQGVALQINAETSAGLPIDDTTRTVLKSSSSLSPSYYKGLITVIADGSGAGIDSIVDRPQSRTYAPIVSAPSTPVAVPYDTLLTAQLTPKIEPLVRANPALDGADEATIQGAIDAEVAAQVAALSSGGNIFQGALDIPSFLADSEAGVADASLGSWTGSNAAAIALGLEGAPADVNGSFNVTYRFPFADKVGDSAIPVMVTMPAASCDPDGAGPASGKPAEGWPVVIYQHGITVDRTAGLLVGNALAGQCIAMVAIDHVMHGVAPLNNEGEANSVRLFNVEQVAAADVSTNSPFAAARAGWVTAVGAENAPELAALKERHNNVAKAANSSNIAMVFNGALDANGDPVTADSVGSSGELYINLQNFSRLRDGMRQTVLDMMNLNASIGDMDVNADGTPDDLDPANVYFIGHSLGGIIGTTFLAVNNDASVQAYNSDLPLVKAAALGNPGGGVVKLLENSPTIGVKILAGLANSGLAHGSTSMESFFSILQASIDSVDPINFASNLATLPVLVYEDVGIEGDADELPDQVVPNNALTPVLDTSKSYLAGTDPLVTEMGITTFVTQETAVEGGAISADPKYYFPNAANAANASIVRANVRIAKGTHSTFSSADPQDVFAETFQQIITFFDPYGATQLLGLPGDQKGFVVEDISVLETSN